MKSMLAAMAMIIAQLRQAQRVFSVGGVFIPVILFLLLGLSSSLYAIEFPYKPEDCTTTTDDDGDGTINNGCPQTDAFSTQTGTDIAAKFEECVLVNLTSAADNLSETGNSVARTDGADVNQAQAKCSGNATGDYFFWVLSYGDTTQSGLWANTTALPLYPSNATLGSVLTRRSTPGWQQVCSAGTNANFKNGTNGDCTRTFTLAGDFDLFTRGRNGVTLICVFGSTDVNASPQCPSGTPAQSFDYEVLDVAAPPTASTDFDGANELVFSGFSDVSTFTVTRARIVWDKDASPPKWYAWVAGTETDIQNGTAAANDEAAWFSSSATRGDSIDLRWRAPADLSAVLDTDTYNTSCNVNDFYADKDWTGGTATLATNLNSASAGTVVASTSWTILCSGEFGGAVTADTIGLAQFFITDRDAAGATSKFLFGTNALAATDPSQWGRFKWSSTAVAGGLPAAPVAGNISFVNVTSSSFIVTWDFDTGGTGNGTCIVKYDTTTGLQGTETQTTPQASAGGTCTVLVTSLTAGTTYYVYGNSTDSLAQTDDSTQGSQATSASTATLFVSASGSGNCLTIGTPCAFGTVWALAVPGSIIEAAAGTYQGSTRMIVPNISGLGGTAANPITVRCASAGDCLIDGQNARVPIRLGNNDWFIIDGFNAKDSIGDVVRLSDGADNNIIRNTCAWNANVATNNMVWSVNNNVGNLLEDVCGFGTGRKIFQYFQSQSGSLTIRRAWGQWEKSTIVGPKMVFSNSYRTRNTTYENVIGTWNQQAGSATDQFYGILGMDSLGDEQTDKCGNNKYLGSIAYLKNGTTGPTASWLGGARTSNDNDCVEFRDTVVFLDSNFSALRPVQHLNLVGATATSHLYTRGTEIGGTGASVGNDWTVTNRTTGATLGSIDIWDGANQANVCFRYVNGTLTSDKLWPWPMNQRIIDAMTAAGKTPVDVTQTMIDIFGAMPAACTD